MHMRRVGGISSKGGFNKAERLMKAAHEYVTKARALEKKVKEVLDDYPATTLTAFALILELTYYHEMLVKHIDLVDRRLLQGETIPHHEKICSIFQPYTEMIKKGKLHPNVEIGKKLAITTDQFNLLLDWQVAEKQTDNQLTVDIADRLISKYPVESISFDRGSQT